MDAIDTGAGVFYVSCPEWRSGSRDDFWRAVPMEDLGPGRRGGIVQSHAEAVVRSMTVFARPPLISASMPDGYNNAMVESYDDRYRNMAWHTDMALDLAPGSHITVYTVGDPSVGDTPTTPKTGDTPTTPKTGDIPTRILRVRRKTPLPTTQEWVIPLTPGSAVTWSLECNRRHVHKIVGRGQWLGVTLRRSSCPGADAVLSPHPDAMAEIRRLRRLENTTEDFHWPDEFTC